MAKNVVYTAKRDFSYKSQKFTEGSRYKILLDDKDILVESDNISERYSYIEMDDVINLGNFDIPKHHFM